MWRAEWTRGRAPGRHQGGRSGAEEETGEEGEEGGGVVEGGRVVIHGGKDSTDGRRHRLKDGGAPGKTPDGLRPYVHPSCMES